MERRQWEWKKKKENHQLMLNNVKISYSCLLLALSSHILFSSLEDCLSSDESYQRWYSRLILKLFGSFSTFSSELSSLISQTFIKRSKIFSKREYHSQVLSSSRRRQHLKCIQKSVGNLLPLWSIKWLFREYHTENLKRVAALLIHLKYIFIHCLFNILSHTEYVCKKKQAREKR